LVTLLDEIKRLNVYPCGQLPEPVIFSIVIAMFPENADDAEHLIQIADLAPAKKEDRDRIDCATVLIIREHPSPDMLNKS
jgi:hypothetical protein